MDYHEDERLGLGMAFWERYDETIDRIVSDPESGAVWGVVDEMPVRRLRMNQFKEVLCTLLYRGQSAEVQLHSGRWL